DSRHQRRARALPGLRRTRRSEEPCDEEAPVERGRRARAGARRVRFRSGADGPRRDGVRRPESEMPRLPDGETVRDSTIVVAAAIVERGGRFLLTRRQKGVHLEGFWEFPGGKCDAGET